MNDNDVATVSSNTNGSSNFAFSSNASGIGFDTGRPSVNPIRKVEAPRSSFSFSGGSLVKGEVGGESLPTTVGIESGAEANPNAEVGSFSGAEAGGDTSEASAEQLRASDTGTESAAGDLRSIEGFEMTESSTESSALATVMQEAGEGGEANGNQEFLPFLASLIPTLVSTAGPALAKGIMGALSPRAARVIKQVTSTATAAAAPAIFGRTNNGPNGMGSLIALLSKMLATAQGRESSEADQEADPVLVRSAVAAMEVIIGNDDRVRINNTTETPWQRICALRITFPTGAVYRGTGFFVGPRAVVTAGHCVYLHNQGGWAKSVEVIPAANGGQRPVGSAVSSNLRSVNGWVNARKPECDYGCIVVPAGSFGGRSLGSFGFGAFSASEISARTAVMAGYPGDKPFAELWGMARKIKTVNDKTLVYDIDSMGGQSGAPVYIKRNGQRYVIGIHNYGASSGNSATRITPAVYARLDSWRSLV
jgi:V8-like Glu-specific endopeptidase